MRRPRTLPGRRGAASSACRYPIEAKSMVSSHSTAALGSRHSKRCSALVLLLTWSCPARLEQILCCLWANTDAPCRSTSRRPTHSINPSLLRHPQQKQQEHSDSTRNLFAWPHLVLSSQAFTRSRTSSASSFQLQQPVFMSPADTASTAETWGFMQQGGVSSTGWVSSTAALVGGMGV